MARSRAVRAAAICAAAAVVGALTGFGLIMLGMEFDERLEWW